MSANDGEAVVERRTTVYVMGPYSADNVMSVLENIRRGQRLGTQVILAGYAPFVPWLDFPFTLMLRDGERLAVEDYYEYSIAWLMVADCALLDKVVMAGWEKSRGTLKEIEVAKTLNIPIYESLSDLCECVPRTTGENYRERH
jgi:hypothetical protein